MQRSIATVSVAGTLPEKLCAIAEAGFRSVEIFAPDLQAWGGKPQDIAALAQELGLTIALFQPFRDFEGMPVAQRAEHMGRARDMLENVRALGGDLLLLCSNTVPESSADPERQLEDLSRLAELARQYGVRVGYEALAWGRHIHRYRDARARVKAVDSPALGIVLDSFHVLAVGDSLQLDDIPLDKIFFVQLADAPLKDLPSQAWSRHYRCFPGEGALPVAAFARTLKQKGYAGPWSLEIFSDRWQNAPASDSVRAGYSSLSWLQAQLTDGV